MLSRDEAIEILEELARESKNAAARIAAIKQLEEMRDEQDVSQGDFQALYEVGSQRMRQTS